MFLDKLKSVLAINTRAYTQIVVGSILAIMIGSILLIVTYVVLSSLFTAAAAGMVANSTLNTSLYASMTTITQALTIVGISLIIAGIGGIIYMLLGVAGMTGASPRGK